MNCFNRLRFTVLTCVLIDFLLWKTVNGLEGKCWCANSRCKEPISLGTGTITYPAGKDGMVSFQKQSKIKILWKGIDSNKEYWGIEVDGRQGYVPRNLIREDHVLVKRESLTIVDIPLPAATPPNNDPTQATELKSMDINAAITTTPPNKEINIPIDKGLGKSGDLKPNASPVLQKIETAEEVMLDVNNSKPDQNFQVKETIDHKNIKTEEPRMPTTEVKDKSLTSTATTDETSKNETIKTTQASTEFVQGKENPTVKGLTSSPENDVGQKPTIGESGDNQAFETSNQRNGAQNFSQVYPTPSMEPPALIGGKNIPVDKGVPQRDDTNQPNASPVQQRIETVEKVKLDVNSSKPDQNSQVKETIDHKNIKTEEPTMPKAEAKDKPLTSATKTDETSQNETITTTQASTEFVQGKENPTVKELTSSPENDVGQNATIGEPGDNQAIETSNQRHGAQNSAQAYGQSDPTPSMEPPALIGGKNIPVDKGVPQRDDTNQPNASPVQQRIETVEKVKLDVNSSKPDQNSQVKETIDHKNIKTEEPTMPKAEAKDKPLTSATKTDETSQNETITTTQASTEFVQGKENPTVKELTSSPENDVGQNATIGEPGDNQAIETSNQRHGAQNSAQAYGQSDPTPSMEPPALIGGKNIPVDKGVPQNDNTSQPNASSVQQRIETVEKVKLDVKSSKPDQNSQVKEAIDHKNIKTEEPTMPKAEAKDKPLTSTTKTTETNQNETIKTTQVSTEFAQGNENPTVKELASSPENYVGQNATIGESGDNQAIETSNQRHGAQNSAQAYGQSDPTPSMEPPALIGGKNIPVDKGVPQSDDTNQPNASPVQQRIETVEKVKLDVNSSKPDQNSPVKEAINHKNRKTEEPTMPMAEAKDKPLTSTTKTTETNQNETIKTTQVSTEFAQGNENPTVKELASSPENDVGQNMTIAESTYNETIETVNLNHGAPNMSMPAYRNSNSSIESPGLSKLELSYTTSSEQEPFDSSALANKSEVSVTQQEAPKGQSVEYELPNTKNSEFVQNDDSSTANKEDKTVNIESVINQNEPFGETIIVDKNTEVFTNNQSTNSSAKTVASPQVSEIEKFINDSAFEKNSADILKKIPASNKVASDATTILKPSISLGPSNPSLSQQHSPEAQPSIYEENPESFEQQSHVDRTGHESLIVNQSHNNRYESSTESKTLGKIENHENSGVGNSNQPQSPKSYVGIAKQTKDQSEEQPGTQTENEKTATDGLEEQSTESYTHTQVDWHGNQYTTPPIVSSDIPQTQNARNMVEKQLTESSEEKVAAALDSITDLPRVDTESVPIVLPSIWPQELEGVKQQQGLFATILDTVNSFLSSDKKEPFTADVQDNELHRILYPEKQNEAEYYKKVPLNSCSSEDDRLADSHPSSTSCKCDVAKITMNSFAEDLAASILNISDVLACLAITAASALVFIFGYYCFCNSSREGTLLAKLNLMERSLLATHKENAIIKHELMETRGKLSSIEDNSFGANEMVMALKKELEAELVEKQKSQEQVANLEKELENAAEAGLELNKIVSDLLSNQTGDESIISSVEELQKQLNEQQNTILEINANLAEKSRENSDLHLMIAEQNVRLTGEIATLQQDNDELEAEKSNLQTRLDEIKDEFQEDLTKALEEKNLEIQRLLVEITEFKTKCEDQYTKWQTSVAKIEALEDCLKSIKKDPKVNIKDLIDSVNVRAEILDMQKQRVFLKDSLEAETDAKNLLEDQVKIARAEIEKLKYDFNQSEKDKLEAQTRLEVLSNYFKEKETQLQKELSLKEAMWLKQQGEKTSTVDRLTSMQAEIQSLKSRNDSLHAEIEAQLAAHKAQTGTLEHRAHETWLAARQSERRCEEARAEAAALRRKLTALAGGNLNDGTLDGKMGTDASSPIQLDTSEPQLLGRMPPPPFLPPPFIGTAPSFLGMPPPFLSSGPIRPPPLGRLMSPPPRGFVPAHASHMRTRRYTPPDIGDSDNYDDDEDVVPHRVSRWYHSQSPYRSHSPDSRYARDLMSTYDTETDFSPPPSSRDRRSRESRAGSLRAYSPQPLASSPISDDGRKGKKSTANKGSTSIQKHFHENNTSSDSGSASGNSDPERLRIW